MLPHEYTHSWKASTAVHRSRHRSTTTRHARRVLWVYEGSPVSWHGVGARSGLAAPRACARRMGRCGSLAADAQGARLAPLADTAIAAQIGYTQAHEWRPRTRSSISTPNRHALAGGGNP